MIEVTQQTQAGWCVVKIRGRADAEAADQMERGLQDAVSHHAKVAADFAGVEYISSAGLRAVLQTARAAQQRNVEFTVCQLRGPVKKIFEVSGMQHVLRIQEELPC